MGDYIVRATAAGGQVRAFAATTKGLVEEAKERHNMSPIATVALGRLLTGGAMMGTMMKNDADIEQQVAMAKAVLLRHKGVVVDETLSVEGVCASSLNLYKTMVADGYAPEMARMVLPQNVMTNWMWTGSLVAFARVVKLRTDSHAQQEAQELGWLIHDVVKNLYPVSWKALMDN